jgi:hypothetical protein
VVFMLKTKYDNQFNLFAPKIKMRCYLFTGYLSYAGSI